jgi:hypothetical protein
LSLFGRFQRLSLTDSVLSQLPFRASGFTVDFAAAAIKQALAPPSVPSGELVDTSLLTELDGPKREADVGQSCAVSVEVKNLAENKGPARNLSRSEQATLDRMTADPKFSNRGLRPSAAERDGEYTDNAGRVYDQMGDPKASQYWNEASFLKSIRDHLNKSIDYVVIDLNGFSVEQAGAVNRFLGTLTPQELSRIIRIGF